MPKHRHYPRGPVLTVHVTPEIIERGVRGNSKTCMIAEAIKEAFPNARVVSVDVQTCRFTDPTRGLRYTYLTPRAGQKPLLDFDEGINPQPFTLTLKNAHVTAAQIRKAATDKTAKVKSNAAARLPAKKTTRLTKDGAVIAVGGRAPAQMRTQRRFGLKAFVRGDGSTQVAPPPG